jgi:hypothetical protein
LDFTLDPYTNDRRFTAPIVGVWVVIGILMYFVLRARNPAALDRVDDVYGGEGQDDEGPSGSTTAGWP